MDPDATRARSRVRDRGGSNFLIDQVDRRVSCFCTLVRSRAFETFSATILLVETILEISTEKKFGTSCSLLIFSLVCLGSVFRSSTIEVTVRPGALDDRGRLPRSVVATVYDQRAP